MGGRLENRKWSPFSSKMENGAPSPRKWKMEPREWELHSSRRCGGAAGPRKIKKIKKIKKMGKHTRVARKWKMTGLKCQKIGLWVTVRQESGPRGRRRAGPKSGGKLKN